MKMNYSCGGWPRLACRFRYVLLHQREESLSLLLLNEKFARPVV